MAVSAGILVYRRRAEGLEFLLGHPGGPFWSKRNLAAWSIPKGLVERGEDSLAAARREFLEETGLTLSTPLKALTPVRQTAGKMVMAWAAEADLDLAGFQSGVFEMEWPPRSGRMASFPEIDRLRYFPTALALAHMLPAQAPLISQVLVDA